MSTTNANQSRPSTTSSITTSGLANSLNAPGSQVAQHGDLSCPPSKLTEISSRPYTAVTAPTIIEAQVQEAAHSRPASAYTDYANGACNRHMSLSGPLRPPEYFARPDLATSAVLNLSAPVHASSDHASVTGEHTIQNSSDGSESALVVNRPYTAEAALPPRRELPFPRSAVPRSAGSDSSRPSSRPSTGMMGPPPLPARVASLRPGLGRTANQESELPPLPKPTIVSSAQQQPSWMQQPPRTPDEDQIIPPNTQSSTLEDLKSRSSSSSNSYFTPSAYRKVVSNSSPLTQPLSSPSNITQNRHRTESQSPVSTPTSSSTVQETRILAARGNAIDPAANDNLASYAVQSEENRRAALNEFIFKHLEDDNFLTLLEDMETCWARVGLGMK
jgi:hypothetical protein